MCAEVKQVFAALKKTQCGPRMWSSVYFCMTLNVAAGGGFKAKKRDMDVMSAALLGVHAHASGFP